MKRLMAILLTWVMLFNLVPLSAYAEEGVAVETETESVTESEAEPAAESMSETETAADSVSEVESGTAAESVSDVESETETETISVETEAESVPVTETKTETTVPETEAIEKEPSVRLRGTANSASVVDEGTDANGIGWILWDNGELTIYGQGDMADSDYGSPFQAYENQITSIDIQEGVTAIGDGAFMDLQVLTSVSIASSVTRIGHWAFEACHQLTELVL